MATFNYVRLGSRVGVIQNGRTNRRWFSPEDIKPVKDTERGVMVLEALNNGSYSATINPETDTVVLDGTTIAAGGTLDALETALVGSSVFLKPSQDGGGSVNSVTGNLVGGTSTDPTVDFPIGTDRQVAGYVSGEPSAVTLGWKQLSDMPSAPSFSNGVLIGTAFQPSGDALFAFGELDSSTSGSDRVPFYGAGGRLKVGDGTVAGDAVNKGQLDALTSRATNAIIENSAHVAFWGDSLTATLGAYDNTIPYQYGTLSKQTIFNGGVGGQRSDQIKTRFIAFPNKGWGQIFWEGKNDVIQGISASVVIQNAADQVALLTHNRYVVMGVIKSNVETTGTARAIAVDAINAGYASAYGVRYFDVNAYLRTQGDGSANDIADVAAGILPRSLMQADGIHLNAKANGLVATKLFTDYGQYLVTTEDKIISSNNSPALNVSNLPQFSLAKGGKYQIGGGQVLYLPDQTVNTQCIFVGNGGSELLGVNAKQNTSIGVDAFYNLINGIGNVAIGSAAMYFAVNNTACTAVGGSALNKATGNNNVGIGNSAGLGIVAGIENVAVGRNAMAGANGSGNTLIGDVAGGLGTTTFNNNTGVGWHIFISVTGSNNVGLGSGVGTTLTSGSKNLIIGKDIEFVSNTASNQVVIANLIDGLGATGTGTTMAGTLGLGRRAMTTAYVSFPASTTTIASQNITAGVAPTNPIDGDMWFIGDVMYRRIAGVTKQLTFA